MAIRKILDSDDLKAILHNEELQRSQKCPRFIDILKIKRYPIYSRAEELFQEICQNLKLPKGAKLEHPPFFESPEFSIRFNFKNKEEFIAIVNGLNNIESNKYLTELLSIIDRVKGEVKS